MKSFASERRPLGMILLTFFSIVLISLPTNGAVATELLEKAIYTEETVGDLEKAIAIYQKVLAEGKKSAEAAAEAQYRIGVCYEKQGKSEEAAKAFQAVIDDFPSAKAWVAKAKSHQPGQIELVPVPWGNGDEMIYEMKLPTGMGVGHQVFRVAETEREGKTYWKCSAWQTVTINGMSGKSHVLADYATFAPIESRWKHTLLGDSKAKYSEGKVEIDLINKEEPVTLEFDEPVYDNEQAALAFRRLPLKEGYKTTMEISAILTATRIPLGMEVTKVETIKTPMGEFECFKLELDIAQNFWISNDEHRYIVRFEAGGVVADLTEVRPYKPNQATEVKRPYFSVTLPPDWYAYTPEQPDDDSPETTLIDPTASLNSRIEAGPLNNVKDDHDSTEAWLEESIENYRKRTKDFAVSSEGIQSIKVGDREAVSAVFEYSDGSKAKKARRVCLFGETSAVNLRFTSNAEDFDRLQPEIEKILASLRIK
ncbi:MAG: tetratricopeptide repeat protein [Lacipirellulaceae bacterium]